MNEKLAAETAANVANVARGFYLAEGHAYSVWNDEVAYRSILVIALLAIPDRSASLSWLESAGFTQEMLDDAEAHGVVTTQNGIYTLGAHYRR